MNRLRWRKQPNETGLARVCQGERGYELFCDGQQVASASPKYEGAARHTIGYYWVARNDGLGIKSRNTSSSPVATIEEAKTQAESYVRECLGLPQKKAKKEAT